VCTASSVSARSSRCCQSSPSSSPLLPPRDARSHARVRSCCGAIVVVLDDVVVILDLQRSVGQESRRIEVSLLLLFVEEGDDDVVVVVLIYLPNSMILGLE